MKCTIIWDSKTLLVCACVKAVTRVHKKVTFVQYLLCTTAGTVCEVTYESDQ